MKSPAFTRTLLADLPVKVICLAAAVILLCSTGSRTLTERFFSVPLDVGTPCGARRGFPHFPRRCESRSAGQERHLSHPRGRRRGQREPGQPSHSRRVPRGGESGTQGHRPGGRAAGDPCRAAVHHFHAGAADGKDSRTEPGTSREPPRTATSWSSRESARRTSSSGARKTRVQSVASLDTEEIDLTGRTSSFASKVKILLPNTLLKIAGEASADFRATIQEATVQHSFDGVIVAPSGPLAAPGAEDRAVAAGSVKIQGTQLAVDAIRPEQLRLSLDFGGVRRADIHPADAPRHAARGHGPRLVAAGCHGGYRGLGEIRRSTVIIRSGNRRGARGADPRGGVTSKACTTAFSIRKSWLPRFRGGRWASCPSRRVLPQKRRSGRPSGRDCGTSPSGTIAVLNDSHGKPVMMLTGAAEAAFKDCGGIGSSAPFHMSVTMRWQW